MGRVDVGVEAMASYGAKRREREIIGGPALVSAFRLGVDFAALPMSKNFWGRVGLGFFVSLSSNFCASAGRFLVNDSRRCCGVVLFAHEVLRARISPSDIGGGKERR